MSCNIVMWKYVFLLVFLCIDLATAAEADVKVISDRPDLENAKQNLGGSAVYFGKMLSKTTDKPELKQFYISYKNAAQVLKDYGVKFYQIDCFSSSNFKKECENNRGKVILFKKEHDTVLEEEFELQLLFDVDHIVAHTLQFMLSSEVEVVQNKPRLNEIIEDSKGNIDIILGLIKGLGDPDHRYILEAAFVYGSQYKFVITNELSVPPSSGAVWFFNCKKANSTEDCRIEKKKESPKSVLELLQFFVLQDVKRVVVMGKDGPNVIDKLDVKFPINKVYLFDNTIKLIYPAAQECIKQLDDSFYFILVDTKRHDENTLEKFGLNLHASFPTMVFQPSHLAGSDERYYEQWPLDLDFTEDNLVKTLSDFRKNPNKAYKNIIDIVNVEYDNIKSWKQTNQLTIAAGCMQELDACIGFKIAFRRLARSLVYSVLDVDYTIAYVDFTDHPDDAKLNTLPGFKIVKDDKELKLMGEVNYDSMLNFARTHLSSSVRYLPLSGSDHISIPPDLDADGNPMSEENEKDDQNNEYSESDQKDLYEMEDDGMAKMAVKVIKKGIKDDNVTSLSEMIFNKTKDDNELMVTLFYLPWCIKSIMFRETFADVADQVERRENVIKTAVNKVDCFKWDKLCHQENVFTYPVIKVYRNGAPAIAYTGAYDADTLLQSIQMFQAPVLKEITDNESFKMFTNKKAPLQNSASILGIFKSEQDRELAVFKNVAQELFGKYAFAYVAGSIAQQSAQMMHASMPSFTVLKQDDPIESIVQGEDFSNMKEFIEKHSVPSFGELTALNFPKYNMLKKPFVIKFKKANDTSMNSMLNTLASKLKSTSVTWMDMDKPVTSEIMQAYMKNSDEAALVLVSHAMGSVFKYDKEEDVDMIIKWVGDCLENKVTPTAMLEDKEWKPLREGYNYLELIEKSKPSNMANTESESEDESEDTTQDDTAQDDTAQDDTAQDDTAQDDMTQDDTTPEDDDERGPEAQMKNQDKDEL